jgi:hypothetical protein
MLSILTKLKVIIGRGNSERRVAENLSSPNKAASRLASQDIHIFLHISVISLNYLQESFMYR